MAAAAWGVFLASSWTWCIALFLPVILVADVGPGAWSIMVACNVGGVAALPLLFRSRAASLGFLRANATACRVFSVVTMLCQAWFLGWAASRLPGSVAAACIGGVLLLAFAGASRPRWLAAAALCWAATAAAVVADLAASPAAALGRALAEELAWHPRALFALPLVLAGFAASPCLDLTFHHALRACPVPRRAFGLAFPLLFGAMLVASLAYRDELAPLMLRAAHAAPAWLVPVLAAIVLQVGFTLVLHARHLAPRLARPALLACVAAAALAWSLGDAMLPTGQTLNTFLYRSSIGFYGVLVPCYVWACATTGDQPGPAALALAAAALATAAIPMLLVPAWLWLYPAAFLLIVLTRPARRRLTAPARPAPGLAAPAP